MKLGRKKISERGGGSNTLANRKKKLGLKVFFAIVLLVLSASFIAVGDDFVDDTTEALTAGGENKTANVTVTPADHGTLTND